MSIHVVNGIQVVVYPVGVIETWKSSPDLRSFIRREVRHMKFVVRWLDWRSLKNEFNGYLAEPREWPEGLRRCGSGWTERRALADLERRMRRADR